jgi:hypothetical protein
VLEGGELVLPKGTMPLDPVGGFAQRCGHEPALADAPHLAGHDDPGALEDPEVPEKAGQRHRMAAREVTDRGLAPGEL